MALTAGRVTLPVFSQTGTPVLIAGPKSTVIVTTRTPGPTALLGASDLNTGAASEDKSYPLEGGKTVQIELGPGEYLFGMSSNAVSVTGVDVITQG